VRRIRRPGYRAESWHRGKFVVQDFVPGLDHDWKVLVYGEKLYVLRRGVRDGDFRASGSGKIAWPEAAPAAVLDLCWKLCRALDVPWLSVDVVTAGDSAHVIEFQVIYFGTLTLEK
jgi:glutathione synthase/RimK-type ligase-like ATP-grasp enzyme